MAPTRIQSVAHQYKRLRVIVLDAMQQRYMGIALLLNS